MQTERRLALLGLVLLSGVEAAGLQRLAELGLDASVPEMSEIVPVH